ncbi:MAG TPA: hypothetical protein VGT79_00305, partial [Xanthomonadaceae bacterium]|nr:hypothetical protein [Xanthomonadaceae bacterium]
MISERVAKLWKKRPKAIENLQRRALDLPTIRVFLAGFEPPPGELPLPPIEMLDESWAIVRHTQAQL